MQLSVLQSLWSCWDNSSSTTVTLLTAKPLLRNDHRKLKIDMLYFYYVNGSGNPPVVIDGWIEFDGLLVRVQRALFCNKEREGWRHQFSVAVALVKKNDNENWQKEYERDLVCRFKGDGGIEFYWIIWLYLNMSQLQQLLRACGGLSLDLLTSVIGPCWFWTFTWCVIIHCDQEM